MERRRLADTPPNIITPRSIPPHAHTFGDEPSPLHFGFQAAFFPTPPFPPSPASGRGNSGAAYFLGHHPIKNVQGSLKTVNLRFQAAFYRCAIRCR